MKASESARLRTESTLREELEGRWQQLQELDKERVRAQQGQCQVGEGRCPGIRADDELQTGWTDATVGER